MAGKHQVVIVGGGFGGLAAARSLTRAPVEVTLIDRSNYHLFQPLLDQVATGGLASADIASPLRLILRNQTNARVLVLIQWGWNYLSGNRSARLITAESSPAGMEAPGVAAEEGRQAGRTG